MMVASNQGTEPQQTCHKRRLVIGYFELMFDDALRAMRWDVVPPKAELAAPKPGGTESVAKP